MLRSPSDPRPNATCPEAAHDISADSHLELIKAGVVRKFLRRIERRWRPVAGLGFPARFPWDRAESQRACFFFFDSQTTLTIVTGSAKCV